jgi:hypothetical protein
MDHKRGNYFMCVSRRNVSKRNTAPKKLKFTWTFLIVRQSQVSYSFVAPRGRVGPQSGKPFLHVFTWKEFAYIIWVSDVALGLLLFLFLFKSTLLVIY